MNLSGIGKGFELEIKKIMWSTGTSSMVKKSCYYSTGTVLVII